MDTNIDLKGRRVLITGASRGIGAAIARIMAACGARILINHLRDENHAQKLAGELRQQYQTEVVVCDADISFPQDVAGLFRLADEQWGGIDVLVNNAGCETIDHAVDLDLEDWDRVLDVNLRGAFICAQAAAKRMMVQKSGVILNISSIHDKVPRLGLIHYCSAKAGLNMMTKCLALELAAHQVRVVAVSPGAIETEMNREEIEKFGREKFNNWIPAGRIGMIDDVAWTCAFLASDKAVYITATEIYIDGGYKESTIPYDPRPHK